MIIIGIKNFKAVLNIQAMITANTYPTTNDTIISIMSDAGLIAARYPLPSTTIKVMKAKIIVRTSTIATPFLPSYP